MDLVNLPAEFERSRTKIAKIDARRVRASGSGATTGGKALVNRYHDRLAEAFRYALLDAHAGLKNEAALVVILRGLSPELLALCSIQTLLHSIGMRDHLTATLTALGEAASGECWAKDLTQACAPGSDKVAKAEWKRQRAIVSRLTNEVTKSHSNVGRRLASMQKRIEKRIDGTVTGLTSNFSVKEWKAKDLVLAGGWLWNVVSTALPEVFIRETRQHGLNTTLSITLSPDAEDIITAALDQAMVSNPVYWPSGSPPKPWTSWNDGGSWDDRVTASVLRSWHKDTQASVKHAIKTGQMQPALDAVNALQSVAFKINTQVLEVLELCEANDIMVKGMVPKNMPRLVKPISFAWEGMEPAERGKWHAKNAETEKLNKGRMSDRILFAEDMGTAYAMLEHRRFYTPMNCDWRGRIYGLSHFNFQREDRVRALFLFADGEAIGEEGIGWLKVHTANCGDFGKISKRSLKERIQWCTDNTQLITDIASAPFVHTKWMQADKPFLFLAACFELSAALAQGSSYITQLPCSFDGSCSGLQHLCQMTLASEGSMVNLSPSPLPQDVYQLIADDTFAAVTLDLNHEPEEEDADSLTASKDIRAMARLFLDYKGDRRKLAKRNVMTFAYSSKKFGMSSQQQIDLMEVLSGEVLEGKLSEHPFEGYQHGPYDKHGHQQPSKAARYIAGHVYKAILQRIKAPADTMEFLQKIAKAMAHEGKPVRWTTPVGIPWINRYHAPTVERVSLFLNDGGVKLRAQISIATGDQKEIDKAKAANGVAPNFVHALDAAHLLLVAIAAGAAGIRSIATVHDSFGCLASQATLFNKIIREQFSLMYEAHDVLSEILERARGDLTEANHDKLPTLPARGPLNPKDILNAEFAFA